MASRGSGGGGAGPGPAVVVNVSAACWMRRRRFAPNLTLLNVTAHRNAGARSRRRRETPDEIARHRRPVHPPRRPRCHRLVNDAPLQTAAATSRRCCGPAMLIRTRDPMSRRAASTPPHHVLPPASFEALRPRSSDGARGRGYGTAICPTRGGGSGKKTGAGLRLCRPYRGRSPVASAWRIPLIDAAGDRPWHRPAAAGLSFCPHHRARLSQCGGVGGRRYPRAPWREAGTGGVRQIQRCTARNRLLWSLKPSRYATSARDRSSGRNSSRPIRGGPVDQTLDGRAAFVRRTMQRSLAGPNSMATADRVQRAIRRRREISARARIARRRPGTAFQFARSPSDHARQQPVMGGPAAAERTSSRRLQAFSPRERQAATDAA